MEENRLREISRHNILKERKKCLYRLLTILKVHHSKTVKFFPDQIPNYVGKENLALLQIS